MLIFRLRAQFLILVHTVLLDKNCQEAFNKRLPVAVLDLSGTLWPLLIPEHWGIKRRGTPFLGLRNPGISHYSGKYPLPFYEPNGKRWLFATLSLIGIILCFVSLEFLSLLRITTLQDSIYAHAMLIKTPLFHQSFGSCVFFSFYSSCLSLSLSLYFWLIPWSAEARWAHFLARASETLSRGRTVPSPTREGARCPRAAVWALRTGLYWLSAYTRG